jgi:hypothetical protein
MRSTGDARGSTRRLKPLRTLLVFLLLLSYTSRLDMSSSTDSKTDLEKVDAQPAHPAEVVLEEEVASATGPFARLTRWLDAQGVEARGLDRVPESERAPVSLMS